jgi:hypothetical protein
MVSRWATNFRAFHFHFLSLQRAATMPVAGVSLRVSLSGDERFD